MTRFVGELLAWYPAHARDLPWRRTRDPYGIWVSEIMLQQTQVQTVIPYWERWMRELPDVTSLAEATEERVLKLWEGLGYYRRARHLQAAARVVVDRHAGRFPRGFAEALDLPGIGRYTAGAICSIAFDQPTPILDGNVIRVLTRFEALRGDPTRPLVNQRLWDVARCWVEAAGALGRAEGCSHLNQALMELGATVCLPRAPRCEACPLSVGCEARAAGAPERFPTSRRRIALTARHYLVVLAQAGEWVWVRRRPREGVNGGLWEFPNLEVTDGAHDAQAARGVGRRLGFGLRDAAFEPLATIRHAITRYRITQHVFRLRLSPADRKRWPEAGQDADSGDWRPLAALDALPWSSAHRRILRHLRDPAS